MGFVKHHPTEEKTKQKKTTLKPGDISWPHFNIIISFVLSKGNCCFVLFLYIKFTYFSPPLSYCPVRNDLQNNKNNLIICPSFMPFVNLSLRLYFQAPSTMLLKFFSFKSCKGLDKVKLLKWRSLRRSSFCGPC